MTQMEPTKSQQDALNEFERFINSSMRVFFINGEAGTGKTILLKWIVERLEKSGFRYKLMAPTGRAVHEMETRVGRPATTVHAAIYRHVDQLFDSNGWQKKGDSKLKKNPDEDNTIYVIDEASMIAETSEFAPFAVLGDNKILNDIFTYAGARKIIFVGDCIQLPLVDEKLVPVYNHRVFKKYSPRYSSFELGEITRQSQGSKIHQIAQRIRNACVQGIPASFESDDFVSGEVFRHSSLDELVHDFVGQGFPEGPINAVCIAYTNEMVRQLNIKIRKALWKERDSSLVPGDWLVVTQSVKNKGLYKGQQLVLESIKDKGERAGNVAFADAKLYDPRTEKKYKIKMFRDIPIRGSLIKKDIESLEKDYEVRMANKGFDPLAKRFVTDKKSDKFLNALKVQFGYAITARQAQAGEWPNVHICLENESLYQISLVLKKMWIYTAVSRASQSLSIYID